MSFRRDCINEQLAIPLRREYFGKRLGFIRHGKVFVVDQETIALLRGRAVEKILFIAL
jgi:hypothetical protein